jgi:hypothetical protein
VWNRILDHLLQEKGAMLQVIKAAPLAVLLCLGIASYGAFYLTSAFNWRQIENLKTQNSEQQTDIGLLNDRISMLKRIINSALAMATID